MKKIIFIILLVFYTNTYGNYFGEQHIRDINENYGYSWYNYYGVEGESPISVQEKQKRLETANFYGDFFFKNYFLLENKYIKPEYLGIPYTDFSKRYNYTNSFIDYSKNYENKYTSLSDYEKSYFLNFNINNSSNILPLFDYFNSINRNLFENYIDLTEQYINGVIDWKINKGEYDGYDIDKNGNRVEYKSSLDPQVVYVNLVKNLLEDYLITKDDECKTSNTYVTKNNGVTNSVIEGGVGLDFFVRGSRIGYYKKDGEVSSTCHDSYEDLQNGIYYISNDFEKFRNSYINFFDITKNTYSNPKTIEVDIDYGKYMNLGGGVIGINNDSELQIFNTVSGKKPLIKIGSFGKNLEKSLFEKTIGDFIYDKTNPLNTWLKIIDYGRINNFLPHYYDQRQTKLSDSVLKQYYDYEDGLNQDTLKRFYLSKERILPYNYIPGTLSKNEIDIINTTLDQNPSSNVDVINKVTEKQENNYNQNISILSSLNQSYYNSFNLEKENTTINTYLNIVANNSTYSYKRDKLFNDIDKIIPIKIKNDKNKYSDVLRKLNTKLDLLLPKVKTTYQKNPTNKNKNSYELILIVKEWVVYNTNRLKQDFYSVK